MRSSCSTEQRDVSSATQEYSDLRETGGIEAQEVIPAAGIHRYLIAGEDELRLVYLTN